MSFVAFSLAENLFAVACFPGDSLCGTERLSVIDTVLSGGYALLSVKKWPEMEGDE